MKQINTRKDNALTKTTSSILENIYWTAGSHCIYAPNFPVHVPVKLSMSEKFVIKKAVIELLLKEELNWSALLVVVFKTRTENKLITVSMEFPGFNLTVLGDKLKEVIEVSIGRVIKEHNETDKDICFDNLSQYGYFLAPGMEYDYDKMEDGLLDNMNNDCENGNVWAERLPYGTKNFIDSIATLKI